MKNIFYGVVAFLCVASLVTMALRQESEASRSKALHWTTDSNPARELQVRGFNAWLERRGVKDAELRLDTAGAEFTKKIVQGVSGVASDLLDCYPQNGELSYLVQAGLLEDVTASAKELGFDPSKTYPELKDDLMIGGRQYVAPCSANAPMLFVNLGVFKELGLEAPPMRWSFEEFERRGSEFVAKANEGKARRERFFCSGVPCQVLARSLGGDIFNETLTKSGAGEKAFAETFKTLRRWTFELHLIPSASEMASFSTQSGYGGSSFQLFNNGNFATTFAGRFALIQFRQFGALDLDVCEPPNGGFPNTFVGARSVAVYKGSKRKKEAELFQAYLFSEEYNMNIVEDGDSLPPNPAYVKTEAYLKPPAHPNEWKVHSKLAQDALSIAIVSSKSPFASNKLANQALEDAYMAAMSGVMSPEEAALEAKRKIDAEIERTVGENPALRKPYEAALKAQAAIDEAKAQGRPVPAELVANPFHKRLLASKGLRP